MLCTVHYSRVRVNIPSALSRYYHQRCTGPYCTVPYYNLNTPGFSSNITQPGYNQTKTRSSFLHFPAMKKQLYFALSRFRTHKKTSTHFSTWWTLCAQVQDVQRSVSGFSLCVCKSGVMMFSPRPSRPGSTHWPGHNIHTNIVTGVKVRVWGKLTLAHHNVLLRLSSIYSSLCKSQIRHWMEFHESSLPSQAESRQQRLRFRKTVVSLAESRTALVFSDTDGLAENANTSTLSRENAG